MRIKKIAMLVPLVLLLMLCLSGCGQKQVDVQTTLTLKDNHSGSRQMKLIIDKKEFESVFGGSAESLKEQLQASKPSAMEWNPSDNGKQYEFTFTLYFSSLKDYEEKVEGIIGKDASITMEQPESVFASGLRYQEDFTSLDLLAWIRTVLVDQKYMSKEEADALFADGAVKVSFCGEDYESGAGAVQIDTLVETPVERIDILTHYLQNRRCDRQVIFLFSQDSMNKNGEAIRAYLKRQTPDGAETSWTERNGESQCTISIQNTTARNLNTFMSELLGESRSFISIQPQTRTGIFASASTWNEMVDVSAFSYNGGKVAVGYYVQWEDGMELTVRRQNADKAYELRDSEQYGGYQTVLEADITSESLSTETSTTYVVQDIVVDTEFSRTDYLTRSVALIFQVKLDGDDQERIRKRIAREAEGIAEVTVDEGQSDERTSIRITQSGSITEVNKGFDSIFHVQGQLSHNTGGDLLSFKHAGKFVELMDFTGFIENDPVLTTLTYRLRLPGGETILKDSVSSTVDLKKGTQEIDGNEYTGTVTGAYLSLTLDSEIWNTDGIMLFILLLGFVAVLLAILFLADTLRKMCARMKENAGRINEVFGTDDEVLEDFPEEERNTREKAAQEKDTQKKNTQEKDIKKKKRFSLWKKAPYVTYEEVKFEEDPKEETEGSEDFDEQLDPEEMVERVTKSSLGMEEEPHESR